jgi:VanZ family protein
MTAAVRPPASQAQVRLAWTLVVLCIGLILFLGSAPFGAATRSSARVLEFLAWLLPDWTGWDRLQLYYSLRKGGHLLEYAVLGALAFRAVFLTLESALARTAALAMIIVLLVAVADETRQAFLDERSGSAVDVGLDVAGALAAVGLAFLYVRQFARRRSTPVDCADP